MIYETLGVIRGRATVSFGGESGEADRRAAPATLFSFYFRAPVNQCLAPTDDFVVVGAYPSSGTHNLTADSKASALRRLSPFPRCRGPKPIRCLSRIGR